MADGKACSRPCRCGRRVRGLCRLASGTSPQAATRCPFRQARGQGTTSTTERHRESLFIGWRISLAGLLILAGILLQRGLGSEDLALLIGALAILTFSLLVLGILFWWPSRSIRASRSELGAAILGGAAISLAVLWVQVGMEHRTEILQRQAQVTAEKQRLHTALSTTQDLLSG
jgi:hypothetical protein